jgi:RimJ/RimL family protein N-acetyltransferase
VGGGSGEGDLTGHETHPSTGDVSLRDVTDNDLPLFFEHQLDPEANRMAAFPARDRSAFMAHWTRIMGDDTIIKKTVLFDGQVAGNVVSFDKDGQREVGYWIGTRFWGKGVATAALSTFLDLVKMRPLHARVAKHNVASIRVLEKCGFEISGEDSGPSDVPGVEVEGFILVLGDEGDPAR